MQGCTSAMVCVWQSKNNSEESILFSTSRWFRESNLGQEVCKGSALPTESYHGSPFTYYAVPNL